MRLAPFTVAFALSVVLAGCATPYDDEPEPPTAESYELIAEGVPDAVTSGDNFTFTLTVEGEPAWESDHIGAHYGENSTDEPSTTAYDKACAHQAGEAPGTFEVTCSIGEGGVWYLRGHMRITLDAAPLNYWTDDEFTITVLL